MDLKELQGIVEEMENKHDPVSDSDGKNGEFEVQKEYVRNGPVIKQGNASAEGRIGQENERIEMESIDECLKTTEQLLTRFENEMKEFHVRMDELNDLMNEEDFQKYSEKI
ncbi:uncharacterized protein SOCG_01533 [Schizosaccharomyces octosporus yFS286]|uniref:Uncharacterized protein n=1 Tax=Schizosaccharomyces octosporus (strain yFS286) TaxID=483514 RepID=S9RAZ7_SCHOY|nr:uncharacterized protein SOCG_01533 [Schizosaccharomyces octosporus yFS286]EPX71314.1 hypothetical protein SOCG_01533 [Schizosaccharomyces octosporus yFS286]